MKDGSKGYVLTDEGDINKFLGIEIKEITIVDKRIGPTARKSVQGRLLYHS